MSWKPLQGQQNQQNPFHPFGAGPPKKAKLPDGEPPDGSPNVTAQQAHNHR